MPSISAYLVVNHQGIRQSIFLAGPPVHHFDLYRLSGQDEIGRLDFGSALSTGICLIEWPERLKEQAPAERLNIYISMLTEVLFCHSPASCL